MYFSKMSAHAMEDITANIDIYFDNIVSLMKQDLKALKNYVEIEDKQIPQLMGNMYADKFDIEIL